MRVVVSISFVDFETQIAHIGLSCLDVVKVAFNAYPARVKIGTFGIGILAILCLKCLCP